MSDDQILQAARQVLSGLKMPDGSPFLDASAVSGPVVLEGRVTVSITTTSQAAIALTDVRTQAEVALRAIPLVQSAFVVLTNDQATPPPRLVSPPKPAAAKVLPDVRHVIAVASGKGGVGKSTTAVNLALGLRANGLKVGILDADIHGPSIPTLLALHGQPRMGKDRRLLPMQSNGLSAMSMGMMVDAETAMVWRGPMVMSAITQMLAEVDWGVLDVLIVDMPPGTGDAQLAIAQGTTLSGAVIVSTPQDLALIDARRGIAMFRKVDVPILGVIENMAHFTCTQCGTQHALFGTGGAQAEAQRLNVPFLGAIPLTMDLRVASDSGQPIVARDPDGPLGRLYIDMATRIWSQLTKPQPDIKPTQTLQGA
ncbi:Mrp/NBP35 family ATP-binding protein [Sulfitobacter guttiformis]|uniref:Iron-sulfur cluster carrier protein n=1 Tax=Sulfitobacter guttiformis TaxID=74349 RepID=A0A420DJ64_9RHOB|nr:Mrp/NBP35 family ATP-binding protein [Sulfitobacter guttiformis]KIN71955.1 MRP-like protein [Sulfitobacter guttiformis KCTC 32187]RKE94244.1 ATP-binding protein involved in chromosome partitioning [Sulfitobacter guttiformis]